MRAVGVVLLSALTLAACEPDRPARPEAAPATPVQANDFPYCGGELKPGAARVWFQRLEAALAADALVPMSFYNEIVSIQSRGQTVVYRRDAVQPGARGLLSKAEWRQIADRGIGDLRGGGWRGCILADGKAGFQSDENGELVLSSFDRDRTWSSLRP